VCSDTVAIYTQKARGPWIYLGEDPSHQVSVCALVEVRAGSRSSSESKRVATVSLLARLLRLLSAASPGDKSAVYPVRSSSPASSGCTGKPVALVKLSSPPSGMCDRGVPEREEEA
jgi:hypothetical protein